MRTGVGSTAAIVMFLKLGALWVVSALAMLIAACCGGGGGEDTDRGGGY